MHHEQMVYAARLVRLAARELAASEAYDPSKAARYAAVADRLGSLDSAALGNLTDRELLAASPVIAMAGVCAMPLVELLASHLRSSGTTGRWDDAGLVELAKLVLQGQAWRLPETDEDRSPQSPCDELDDVTPVRGIAPRSP
jgi:hypothetical protein